MRHRKTITIPKDRETIISEALFREQAVRLHREQEATILADTPLPDPLPPRPYVHQEMSVWSIIKSKLTLRPFLP